MSRAPVATLLSGGIDSAALTARFLAEGARVHPLYVRCGLRWERAELSWLRRLLARMRGPRLQPLEVVDARALHGAGTAHWSLGGGTPPSSEDSWDSVWLPGRNFSLLACAAAFCARRGLPRAAIGSLRGNPFPDATPAYFRRVSALARGSLGRPFEIVAPFRDWSKERVVRAFPGLPYELTFSCLAPRGRKHCGRCGKCGERREVLG